MESSATKYFMIFVMALIEISAFNFGKSVSFGIVFESVGFVEICRGNEIGSLRFKVTGLMVCGFTDKFASKGWNNTLLA